MARSIISFESINVGDRITVTDGLKLALAEYERAAEEPNMQNVIERQAQAAHVVTELWRASKCQ